MITFDYEQISSRIWEVSCCNGIVDEIVINNIPINLQSRVQTMKIADWLVLPENFRNHFSIVCSDIKCGEQVMAMQLQIRFLSCAAICAKVKSSCFHFIFFDKVMQMKFVCDPQKGTNVKEAMLAVDLGNTRTCAVVCPDINSYNMEKLKLESHYDEKSVQTTFGVWDSVCILGKSNTFKDTSLSFVRVGNDYGYYFRDGSDHHSEMLRSLSTPKRYFWDNEINREWSITKPAESKGLNLKFQTDAELAHIISEKSYGSNYPRAMVLEGIVYELLEQAERMLNHHDNFKSSADEKDVRNWHNDTYYQIKHLAVTFPAAWSRHEVIKYREVIQRSVDYFCSQRCGNEPIKLYMDCNEATAVLVNFIYSEADRFGSGNRWLNLMGKEQPGIGKSLRIGVIDIGGGTSDLAIAEVSWDSIAQATKITTCYTYGTDEAGDAMIAKIVREFIFDKVFDKLIAENTSAAHKKTLKEFVVKRVLPTQQVLARSFWFPLAVQYLIESEKDNNNAFKIVVYDRNKENAKFNQGFASLQRKIKDELDDSDDDSLKILDHFLVTLNSDSVAGKNIEIEFSAEDHRKYRELLKENFRYSPIAFGAAISAYQCNMVVWSGKTSENRDIRKLFENCIPVPFSSFISMNKYEIKNENFPLLGLDGKLTDSKYATAIGAALYALLNIRRDQNFPLTVLDKEDSNSCYWGTVDAQGIFESCLSPEDVESSRIIYNGNQLLIYRSNSNSPLTSAMPSYEFRRKPEYNIELAGDIYFKLCQSNGNLDFKLTGGDIIFKDGKRCNVNVPEAKKYFELRLRMVGEEEIWLDTGKIF